MLPESYADGLNYFILVASILILVFSYRPLVITFKEFGRLRKLERAAKSERRRSEA